MRVLFLLCTFVSVFFGGMCLAKFMQNENPWLMVGVLASILTALAVLILEGDYEI